MNGALLLAALLAAPVYGLARGWLGVWAPDPAVAVLAAAALAPPGRVSGTGVVLLLGAGRGVVLLEPMGAQLIAALLAWVVLRATRDPLREVGGPRPLVLASLLAGLAWIATARGLGALWPPTPVAGRELLLGALFAVPAELAAWRQHRRRRRLA